MLLVRPQVVVVVVSLRIVSYLFYHFLFLSLLLLFSTSISIVEVAATSNNNNNNLAAFVIASSSSSSLHSSSSSSSRIRTIMNNQDNNSNENNKPTTTTTTMKKTTTTTTDIHNNLKKVAAVEVEVEEEDSMNIVHRFGKFIIPTTNVFCISPKIGSIAFVNLRPIVPGHVLVTTQRIVPLVEDLTEEEYLDMWLLVRRVQTILKVAYPTTTAFNIAVQDGTDAGQSIAHVHVHILPRSSMQDGDPFAGEKNDEIYEKLEKWAPTTLLAGEEQKQQIQNNLNVPNDNERIDRTEERMTNEATRYRQILLSLKED